MISARCLPVSAGVQKVEQRRETFGGEDFLADSDAVPTSYNETRSAIDDEQGVLGF